MFQDRLEKPGVGGPWALPTAPQDKLREQSELGLLSLFFKASLVQTPPPPFYSQRALWPSALFQKGVPRHPTFFCRGQFYIPKTSPCCMQGSPWEADSPKGRLRRGN